MDGGIADGLSGEAPDYIRREMKLPGKTKKEKQNVQIERINRADK